MPKYFLVLGFLACTFSLSAQKTKVRAKLTETSVVKDSSGNVFPFEIWKTVISSSNITVYPENPQDENSAWIIKRLTKEEKLGLMGKMPKPVESQFFNTGAKFKTFNETDMNGKRFKIKELTGKVIVVNFWFINCPPCRMEIPELNELVESYKDNSNVIFLAIALDQKSDLREFLRLSPFNYNIIDNGTVLAQSYRVTSFPTHLVIDKEGKVKFHTTGLAKNTVHWVKKSIEESLAAPVVAPGITPGK